MKRILIFFTGTITKKSVNDGRYATVTKKNENGLRT